MFQYNKIYTLRRNIIFGVTLLLITLCTNSFGITTARELDQEDAEVQNHFGVVSYNEGNITKAKEWYQKAANKGSAAAQSNLATMYYKGEGVQKDLIKAKEWYQKAANQGNGIAQNNLGTILSNEGSLVRAVELYKKAANQGLAGAQYNLGVMYEYGQGVDKNFTKAKEWYQKAANQGYALASYAIRNFRH